MKLMMASLAILSTLTVSFSFRPQRTGPAATSNQLPIETAPEKLVCRRGKAQPDEGRSAGFIRGVGRRCYRQIGDARPVLLDPKGDRGAKVLVGEKFQCFAGSMMFELIGSNARPGATYSIRAADGCQTIKLASIADAKVAKGRKTRHTVVGGLPSHPPHHHAVVGSKPSRK